MTIISIRELDKQVSGPGSHEFMTHYARTPKFAGGTARRGRFAAENRHNNNNNNNEAIGVQVDAQSAP